LRAPQGCLRSWGSCCPGHVSTPTHPSSHPRGFRLFTCQRATTTELIHYAAQPSRVRHPPPPKTLRPSRGGGILSPIPSLSIGTREDFRATLRSGRKNSQVNDLRRSDGSTSGCQRCCKSNRTTRTPLRRSSKHHGRSESSGRTNPTNSAAGDHTTDPPRVNSSPVVFFLQAA
jgi:hypothetical protein